MNQPLEPNKQPTLRVLTRPNDANPGGDIFGGWLMSQIDIAGAIAAVKAAKGAVTTVAVHKLTFIKPLYVHDVVNFYAKVTRIGRSSMDVEIESIAERYHNGEGKLIKISDAILTYVAIEKPGIVREIPK